MPYDYTTPLHLKPVALWRLPLADGRVASAALAPTADSCAVVWYLNDDLQDDLVAGWPFGQPSPRVV